MVQVLLKIKDHSIRYIRASIEYLDELEKIEIESFGVEAYSRLEYERLIKNPDIFFLIATHEDELIGYLCGEIEGSMGHLKSIAVKKKYRGRGIGGKNAIEV
jgi:ribosomal-protein-alanine N-acetyltransferase